MKIAFVTSEAVPFAKTGGLADVCGALPIALTKQGHEVILILPLYYHVDRMDFRLRRKQFNHSWVWMSEFIPNVSTYFVENNLYFDRDGLYGAEDGDYSDNAERFAFFSRMALTTLKLIEFCPDIIHVHDWQTALVPVYLKSIYQDDMFFSESKTILTLHNLGYQGIFSRDVFPLLGIPKELFQIEGLEFYGMVNFLKGGIIFSDVLTTVSPTYAKEIQMPESGSGLNGVLEKKRDVLFGILNGIDIEEWNPKKDRFLPVSYDKNSLDGKFQMKRVLQEERKLKVSEEIPLLGMVSRLADQKGWDLVAECIEDIISSGAQIVILGSGEKKYHDLLKSFQHRFPDMLSATIGFDDSLAHKIYAGCDIYLMPSMYEPCGLGQMIALRYGTIPVVRKTGGLADTVTDLNTDLRGNGFVFEEYARDAFFGAVKRAIEMFKNKTKWRNLIFRVMDIDFSWEKSAKGYAEIYKKIKDFA